MYQIQNRVDSAAMLSSLAATIRKFNIPVDLCLRQIGEPVMNNPFLGGAPAGYVKVGGPISAVAYTAFHSTSPIIEFQDWAEIQNASHLWDRLYRDVIKPLKKQDFHFIFHLGNVAGKLVYDIDEALDIIGDYSSYGKVTLMLNNDEAAHLWGKLNGHSPGAGITGPASPRVSEAYHFIFNTMDIDALVVLHGYSAVHLSRDGQVVLAGRPPAGNNVVMNARIRFSAGYQLGLLLQLETWYCMALGLAVLGVEPGPSVGLNSLQLLAYIQDWINIL